uniref:adhesion G-protein coupled receptor G7-like isoform X2 n=1 Tax=Styela clava TaxID=7725 RepID=UPI0019399F0E|nr:adhesion G-protein coupled receptor G7-like isoform X2 [Styela clava]
MAVVFMCSKHEKNWISFIFITMLARYCCSEDSGSGFEENTTGSSHGFETTTHQLGNTTGELFTSTAKPHDNITMTTPRQTTQNTTYQLGNTTDELLTSTAQLHNITMTTLQQTTGTAQPHNITMTTSQQTTENTTFHLGNTTGKMYTSTAEPHNITMTTSQQTTQNTTYQLGNTTGEIFTSTVEPHNITMTTPQQTTQNTTYRLGNTTDELYTSTAKPHNITMTTAHQTTQDTTYPLGNTTGELLTSTAELHNITMTSQQTTRSRTTEFHEITMTTSQQTTGAVTLHEITTSTEHITTTLSCELICNGGNQECIDDKCVCSDGYESVNKYCTKVCPDTCPKHSSCKNAENGCQCDSGFTNYDDDSGCIDIDECKTNCNDIISQNCTNYPGSFSCSCKAGYYLYEDSCLPQPEECPKDCGEHSECKDPSKGCECAPGWTYGEIDEKSCPNDVDECKYDWACSDPTLLCKNTPGSYMCYCIDGYRYSETERDKCVPERCPEDTVSCSSAPSDLCLSSGEEIITFPSTLFGYSNISDNSCPSDTENEGKPYGTRLCSIEGSWETPIWLSSCNLGIENLGSKPIETEEDRIQTSDDLEVLTSSPEELDSADIATTIEIIDNVTNTESIPSSVATSVVSTISNVMESPSLEESQQTDELLMQLDDIASKVILDEETEVFTAISNNVSMLVYEVNTRAVTGVGVAVLVRPDSSKLGFRADQMVTIYESLTAGGIIDNNAIEATIYVPHAAFKNSRVAIYVFGNNNLFPRNTVQAKTDQERRTSRESAPPNAIVNSIVLSATIDGVNVSNLPKDNQLTFSTPSDIEAINGTPFCAYWDETLEDWFTDGCTVNHSKSTDVSIACECDHLTNFATLFDITGTTVTQYGLDIVTIVGCSLSSVALILLILTFVFIPKTRTGRKFLPAYLLLSLSLALLGLNITLLVSEMSFVSSPENASSCTAIAVFLHLFLLGSCCWMNCEAVMLWINIVKPIYARSRMKYKKAALFATLYAWMFPILFVGIVLAVDKSVYDRPYEEGKEVTCWIKTDMVLYLTVIPLSILISFNVIVYVILTFKMCRNHTKTWGPNWKILRKSQKKNIIVNVCLAITLGLTWVFGFFVSALSFSDTAVIVFAYIFTILNSLQGTFLFCLYIVRSKDIRKTIASEFYRLSQPIFSDKTKLSTDRTRRDEDLQGNPYSMSNDLSSNQEQSTQTHEVKPRLRRTFQGTENVGYSVSC